MKTYQAFAAEVRACGLCQGRYFDHDPKPVFLASPSAKVLIVGQAPGRKVHETGLPWNDPSGDTLREWLQLSRERFYDPEVFAIVPMALCYPGTVQGRGDLPPPPICAPTWQPRFREYIRPQLTLLIGRYAQHYFLQTRAPVAEVVAHWRAYRSDGYFPLPHPSPRNRKWLRDRPWFDELVLPELRAAVEAHLPGVVSSVGRSPT